MAPRAIDQWMSNELRALFCLQTLDHVLDLLAVVLVGNQNGVLGFDDDQVLDADSGHQSMVRLHQAVTRVDSHHIAFKAIGILVVRPHVPDRCPTAQIVPACVQRYDQTEIGVLHDRVVHGLIGAQGKLLGRDVQEVAVGIGVSQGYAACRQYVGTMLFQLSQEHRGTEHEHTAVPQVSTRGQVFGSHFRRRLLLERLDCEATLSNGFTTVDVAKTGFSVSRGNPERHQATRLGVHLSNRYRLSESFFVVDMVIGSQYQQDRVSAISRCFERSQGDGRRSVAGERLEDDTTTAHLRNT